MAEEDTPGRHSRAAVWAMALGVLLVIGLLALFWPGGAPPR